MAERTGSVTASGSGGGALLMCASAVATAEPLVERSLAREHLEADDPECIEVAGAGGRVAQGLLGREVLRGAHDLAGAGVAEPSAARAMPKSVSLAWPSG
jgi:hypothetical protein